jgi:2-polyprenyl-3-methyl-5-hydroxy-6-metoxy-1,4-benzoquinol methylase
MTVDPYSYDPKTFFDSFYRTMKVANWITDRQTVGELDPRHIRHHYNSLENLILESIGNTPLGPVLDFGAGAGHWADFALNVLETKWVDLVDTSSIARDHLSSKYSAIKQVEVYDSLYKTFTRRYDAVFAIGVLFHIVDDAKWESTLHRLIERLTPGGRLFVSEKFHTYGTMTELEPTKARDVQFHATDKFSTWAECYNVNQRPAVLVHKRLRCLYEWKRVVREAGAKVELVWYNRAPFGYITPENSLMVVRKEDE